MKAEKFDPQFEDDVDITASLDLSKARRVLQTHKMRVIKLIPSIFLALTTQ